MFQSGTCRSSKHRKTPSSIEVYPHFKRLSPPSYEPHIPKPYGLSDLFCAFDRPTLQLKYLLIIGWQSI